MYHSALTEPINSKEEQRFEKNGSIAFKHNILFGVPSEFDKCDVFYSEPAWVHGYRIFNDRAKETGQYAEYVESLMRFVDTGKPCILIMGKEVLKSFPSATKTKVKLNGADAVAYWFNFKHPIELTPEPKKHTEIIKWLSENFNVVGDMCCGYGNTGKIFLENGKGFVMCDYNAKCIGAIKENFHS